MRLIKATAIANEPAEARRAKLAPALTALAAALALCGCQSVASTLGLGGSGGSLGRYVPSKGVQTEAAPAEPTTVSAQPAATKAPAPAAATTEEPNAQAVASPSFGQAAASVFTVRLSRQAGDGNWLAEVPELPGISAEDPHRAQAQAKAEAQALRLIADRVELKEPVPAAVTSLFAVIGPGQANQ